MTRDSADVLVIGAGVFGLGCAWACLRRGLRVIVAEAEAPGAGASGGVVGALSPHMPDAWSAKKAVQREALLAAEGFWAEVAAAGGVDPGYARIGRLMPLVSARARSIAEARTLAAGEMWRGAAVWEVGGADRFPGWLAPEAAPFGAVIETLSARIDPRRAVAALAAAVAARGGVIRCGWRATAVGAGGAEFDAGRIAAGAVILAAGAGLGVLAPGLPGRGVKGQAAVLDAAAPPGAPMIYADGIYVVPRPDGRVAVGSTSEDDWDDPTTPDARLDAVIARARALCPALAGAAVVERWAGLRPRGARPDPMLGPLPGRPGVFVAGGGFKIGFAITPWVGEVLADMATGRQVALPAGFSVADHVAAATGRAAADI